MDEDWYYECKRYGDDCCITDNGELVFACDWCLHYDREDDDD